MNRFAVVLCAGALLLGATLGMPGAACAQNPAAGAASGPFADTPADHWAYQAVDTLQKAGIVIGYPDGTYGGRRAMTRYEFAVAIARILPLINANAASKSDLSALQQDMQAKLDQNQQALDALKSLIDEFQPELTQLGQDVAADQARLDALEQRLVVVEAEQRRVKVTGDVNFIARGNVNTSSVDTAPLDKDGYRVGAAGGQSANLYNTAYTGDATSPASGGDTSLWNDIDFYNDILLTIDGRVSDNAHAIVKLEGGDYAPFLGTLTGTSDNRINGLDTANGAGSLVDVYEAYLDVPVSLGPHSGAEVQVGRFGNQFTRYTLMAYNPDSYAAIPETDSGNFPMDGAKLIFSAGPAHVQLYAAKNDLNGDRVVMVAGPNVSGEDGGYRPGTFNQGGISYGGDYNYTADGGEKYVVDQSAGGRITVGHPQGWMLGATAIWTRVNAFGDTLYMPIDPYQYSMGNDRIYNTVAIYGADANGTLPFFVGSDLTLHGELAETPTGSGSLFGNVNNNHANQAWEATVGWAIGPFSVKGGYQEVYPDFFAPGDWGHVGDWIDPVNVKGPIASASLAFSPRLVLAADGKFYQGAETLPIMNDGGLVLQAPLSNTGERLTHYDVGLKYGLTSQYSVDLGYEWDQWQLNNYAQTALGIAPGKPTEQYITIGLGHSFNKNASLKMLYQILEYDDKGTGFDPYSEGAGLNGKERGGVAITQFAIKF